MPDAPEQQGTPTGAASPRSVTSNAAFSLLTLLVTAALTAVLTVVLVRALSVADYGVFALATSIGALAFLPADFGIINSTQRLIAEHRRDHAEVQALLLDGLRLKAIIATIICGGLAAAAGPLAAAYSEPHLAGPLRLVAIAILAQTMLGLLGATVTTLGRSDLNLRIALSEGVLEFVASVSIVLAGGGVIGASVGRAAGYVGGLVLAVILVLRFVGLPAAPRPWSATRAFGRRIRRYAGALLIVDGAFTLFSQIDVLLVGGFLSSVATANFQAPLRLLSFLHYPGYSLAAAISPRYSREGGRTPDPRLLAEGLRIIVLLQFAITVPTIVWAGPIAHLVLGSGYGGSAAVLRGFGPYTFLQGFGPLLSLTVNYAGEARRRVPIAIAAVVVDAAIGVALIPSIGAVGGTVSTDVGYALYAGAHLWLCRRMFGLRLGPLAVTFAQGLVAAAAMAGVLLAVGTSDLGPLEWIGGGALAVAAYGAVLFGTRALGREDVRLVRRLIAGRSG